MQVPTEAMFYLADNLSNLGMRIEVATDNIPASVSPEQWEKLTSIMDRLLGFEELVSQYEAIVEEM